MIWAAMSSAGVGPLCFLKSTVNAAIYQEMLEHFMLPSTDKLYGDADFIFQQDLAPAHTAKGTKSWFNDHGVTVLDWPANSPDMNHIENQEEDERYQTQQCRWPEVGSRGLMDRALDLEPGVTQGCGFESQLWQEVSMTEVRPLSKVNPQLPPGCRNVGCPLLHLDGLNAENTFHSSLYSV